MVINTDKTEVTYFSNDSKEAQYKPSLELHGVEIGFNPTPKFLGVTFDRHLTFTSHIDQLKKKMKSQTKTLRAL